MHRSEWEHDKTATVDHVIGAFYLIRRSLFDSLGGFDERFFVYLEDLDFSLRAYQAGWRSVYLTGVQAFHAGGGTSAQVMATRLFYSLRSRLFYGFKHFSVYRAWGLLFITLALEPWIRLGVALLRGSWRDASHTLHAYVLLVKSLPDVLLFSRR
jgi:GT2 family glycosyltransferase